MISSIYIITLNLFKHLLKTLKNVSDTPKLDGQTMSTFNVSLNVLAVVAVRILDHAFVDTALLLPYLSDAQTGEPGGCVHGRNLDAVGAVQWHAVEQPPPLNAIRLVAEQDLASHFDVGRFGGRDLRPVRDVYVWQDLIHPKNLILPHPSIWK